MKSFLQFDESKHYDEGSMAALKGKKYSENPYEKGSKENLDWSKGHNVSRSMKEDMELEEQLQEVLSKDSEAGDWIDDFVKSDNPKFAGKSKKERIKMALGAYYGAQKEEVELDEGFFHGDRYSKGDKVIAHSSLTGPREGVVTHVSPDGQRVKVQHGTGAKSISFSYPPHRLKKQANEEYELDEEKHTHVVHTLHPKNDGDVPGPKFKISAPDNKDAWKQAEKLADKHGGYVDRVVPIGEELDLDESLTGLKYKAKKIIKRALNVDTDRPYPKAAGARQAGMKKSDDSEAHRKAAKQAHSAGDKRVAANRISAANQTKKQADRNYRAAERFGRILRGGKPFSEEVELDEAPMASYKEFEGERSNKDALNHAREMHRTLMKHGYNTKNIWHLGNVEQNQEADYTHPTKPTKKMVINHMNRGSKIQSSHVALHSIVKKSNLPEGYELEEAADFIQQHLADKDINSKVEGKTVKVHSSDVASAKKHLTKAGYKDHKVVGGLNEQAPVAPSIGVHRIQVTVSDPNHPMVSKRKEQLQKFVRVNSKDKNDAIERGKKHFSKKGWKVHSAEHVGMIHEELDLDESSGHKTLETKLKNMQTRDKFASGEVRIPSPAERKAEAEKENKLKKEESMLTYSEFMEKIQEGKIDDLKDRLAAAREKRLSDYDFSKEKEAPKSNVTVHKAKHSSDDNDDEDENKPAQPEVKRGRGRPKGSVGTYKRK